MAATCLLGAIGVHGSVSAQEPGVVYEPGSPSGKEYAIPVEEARRDGGGARPGAAGPLAFGIGISKRGGGSHGSEGAAAQPGQNGPSRGGEGGSSGGSRPDGDGSASSGASANLRERLADAEAAGAPALWKLAPLLLVLLPGLLVGLLLALRGRQMPAT